MIRVRLEPVQFIAGRESELVAEFTNDGSDTCTDVVFKLGLPASFLLLRGRSRIEIPQIPAGRTFSSQVIVRPASEGSFVIGSENFSYRNGYGSPVRVPNFRAKVTVLSGTAAAERSAIDVRYAGGELAPDEWGILRLKVTNASDATVRDLTLTASGPLRIVSPGPRLTLGSLHPGEDRTASLTVFPESKGRSVPVHVHSAYVDRLGRAHSQDDVLPVAVLDRIVRSGGAVAVNGGHRDTILYLAASPKGMAPLESDKEMREIEHALQLGRYRDRFWFKPCTATRFENIGQALMDFSPRIVHFSGHGEPDGSVYVEDELRYRIAVPAEGLARLFGLHADTVQCVIVNACATLRLAEAMVKQIDYVVAMRQEIRDSAAITFSIGFYQGLAGGASVPDAFERGCAFLQSQPLGKSEHDVPALLSRGSMSRARHLPGSP